MEKKTIIIISFVSALFSLLYVLLSYYGIIRYYSLYLFSTEKYANKYKMLDKIGQYKTIISLTATPKQISKLSHVIKSLLDQTVRVDLISLIIPYGNQYNIPEDLKKSVVEFRCGQDQGILNCLAPAVLREAESTTRIITLGASTIYGKDFIETLLEESEKYPDKIIYINDKDDIDLTKGAVFFTKFFNTNFVNIPEGVDGNQWVNNYFKNFPKHRLKYRENYKSM